MVGVKRKHPVLEAFYVVTRGPRLEAYLEQWLHRRIGHISGLASSSRRVLVLLSSRILGNSKMRSARSSGTLLGVLMVLSALCYPQHNIPVRVCIAGFDYVQKKNEAVLQQQARAFTSHKPDKTTHITTEGVLAPALKGTLKLQPSEKLSDVYGKVLAKEDYETASGLGCDYALFSLVTDASREMGPPPSTSLSSAMPSPLQAQSAPETSVIVIYRLQRINPPALVGDGSIPIHAAAPRNVVIADGLDAAVNQAFQKIAKDPQVPVKKP